jgi:hypothetical protein
LNYFQGWGAYYSAEDCEEYQDASHVLKRMHPGAAVSWKSLIRQLCTENLIRRAQIFWEHIDSILYTSPPTLVNRQRRLQGG